MSDWKDWDYMFEKGKEKINKPLTGSQRLPGFHYQECTPHNKDLNKRGIPKDSCRDCCHATEHKSELICSKYNYSVIEYEYKILFVAQSLKTIYYDPNTEFPICKSYENKQQKQKQQQKIIKKQKFNNMIRRDKIDILTSVKNGKNDVALFITSVLYYFIIWAILVCSIKSSPLMGIYFILSVLVSWFIVTEHLRVFAYFIDFTLITLWVLLWGGPYTVIWMVVLSGFEVVRMCILECDQNEMQTM